MGSNKVMTDITITLAVFPAYHVISLAACRDDFHPATPAGRPLFRVEWKALKFFELEIRDRQITF